MLNKSLTCNFVLGKSRLPPNKVEYLKVGITNSNNSGLKTAVTEEINLEPNKIYFWCDSKTSILTLVFM